jgi:hypothetical protein
VLNGINESGGEASCTTSGSLNHQSAPPFCALARERAAEAIGPIAELLHDPMSRQPRGRRVLGKFR